jgi:putative transposase
LTKTGVGVEKLPSAKITKIKLRYDCPTIDVRHSPRHFLSPNFLPFGAKTEFFIACVDGLKGFPEAIEAVYPRTEVQLCIVHLVRASLNYVPWKARKPVAADLQLIYRASTVAEAEQHLAQLEGKWKAYPCVSQVWRRNWARITPFFNYPPDIRKAIYTTNSVESLNRSLRKIIKTRGGFPHEEAALKLLFLALRQAAKKWTMPIHHWREALNHFTILWPERMPALERIPQ